MLIGKVKHPRCVKNKRFLNGVSIGRKLHFDRETARWVGICPNRERVTQISVRLLFFPEVDVDQAKLCSVTD